LNTVSPSAKYYIKGIVEINLCKNKGSSFGGGRGDSIEKTPLSYINNNSNVHPILYSLDLLVTILQLKYSKVIHLSKLEIKIIKP
jgi:hypothetical protein